MQRRSGIHQLEAALSRVPGEHVTLGKIIDTLGPGAWGLCLLLFGVIAFVPGIAPLFGVALCTTALGMVAGQERPWLPQRMRRWRAERGRLSSALTRIQHYVAKIERLLHERGDVFLTLPMLRLVGLAALIDGVLIVLPVPFGNTAPAVAVLIIAMGLVTRDGFAVLAGLIATAIATLIDVVLVWLGYQALVGLIESVF